MWRLTEEMVRSTLVTACRLATSPTSTSPDLLNATTDVVVRDTSALAMTVGSPPSRTATTELVVPRSIPTARAMCARSFVRIAGACRAGLESYALKSALRRAQHQIESAELESVWLNYSSASFVPGSGRAAWTAARRPTRRGRADATDGGEQG